MTGKKDGDTIFQNEFFKKIEKDRFELAWMASEWSLEMELKLWMKMLKTSERMDYIVDWDSKW